MSAPHNENTHKIYVPRAKWSMINQFGFGSRNILVMLLVIIKITANKKYLSKMDNDKKKYLTRVDISG